MALTDAKIRTAKAKASRYRLTDTHGLSVEISPTGSKYWRYRYRINGVENLFAAGEWCQPPAGESPEAADTRRGAGMMTLAEARAERLVWRAQVKSGQHPRLVRAAKRLLAAGTAADTFEAVTREFIEKRGVGWGASHRRHFLAFMEQDAFPDLGPHPIGTLGPAHVLAVLAKVEKRGANTIAHIGRGFLGQVFRYAVAAQKAPFDPTRDLRAALAKVETQHHATLGTAEEVKRFLQAVAKVQPDRQTEIAVHLLALTMLRTIELRSGIWPEIDVAGAEWRIPATKMKMKRPHIVPLSRQAVELLVELQKIAGRRQYLFPSTRSPGTKPMGTSALGRVFERAGYRGKFTPHGFRGTASTLLREARFNDRAIELQLAHADKNSSRKA